MNWLKRLFKKDKDRGIIITVDNSKCICELNAEGKSIMGWCSIHKTDWI